MKLHHNESKVCIIDELELIQKCKNNDAEAVLELWNRNRGYIYTLANRFKSEKQPVDDLIQESYICLYDAVKNFDTTQNLKFITYFSKCLFIHYIKLYNYNKRKNQELCILNAPVSEESEETLADLISDETAEYENDVIDNVHRSELKTLILNAINEAELNNDEKLVLDQYFWRNNPVSYIADEVLNTTSDKVSHIKNKSIQKLGKTRSLRLYRKNLINSSIMRSGYGFYRNNRASTTEYITIKLIEAEEKGADKD